MTDVDLLLEYEEALKRKCLILIYYVSFTLYPIPFKRVDVRKLCRFYFSSAMRRASNVAIPQKYHVHFPNKKKPKKEQKSECKCANFVKPLMIRFFTKHFQNPVTFPRVFKCLLLRMSEFKFVYQIQWSLPMYISKQKKANSFPRHYVAIIICSSI